MTTLPLLLERISACRTCADQLPLGPRPVVQLNHDARILIIGQAPGTKVHESGIPFNDPSGDRLRDWLGLDRPQFYDPGLVALMPSGFCYPGRSERGGDLPPRKECATQWHPQILPHLQRIELTLLVGQYAQAYYLGADRKKTLTETVAAWRSYLPDYWPTPHPSWRVNQWLKKNDWFESEVLPELRRRVADIVDG